MESICEVCTLKYSKKRRRTICKECNFQCCSLCFKRCVLEKKETEQKCMNTSCSFVYSYTSIFQILGKITTNKIYKDILVEKEKHNYRKIKNSRELKRQKNKLCMEYMTLSKQIDLMEKVYLIQERNSKIDPNFFQLMMKYSDGLEELDHKIERIEMDNKIEKCPDPSCEGYIFSDSSVCTTCNQNICKKCLNIDYPLHVCDENIIKNIEEIRQNTRQCPVCENNIFKIEGCNQMFCTFCNTKFDWVSGEIFDKTTNYHNNHFVREINSHKKNNFLKNIDSFQKKVTEKHSEFEIIPKIIYRLGFEVLPLYKQKLLDSKSSFEKKKIQKIDFLDFSVLLDKYKQFLLKSHIKIKTLEKDCEDFTRLFEQLTKLMEDYDSSENNLIFKHIVECIDNFILESQQLFWKRNEVCMYTRINNNLKKMIQSLS